MVLHLRTHKRDINSGTCDLWHSGMMIQKTDKTFFGFPKEYHRYDVPGTWYFHPYTNISINVTFKLVLIRKYIRYEENREQDNLTELGTRKIEKISCTKQNCQFISLSFLPISRIFVLHKTQRYPAVPRRYTCYSYYSSTHTKLRWHFA